MLDREQDRLRRALVRANRMIRADRPPLPENQQAVVKRYPTWTGNPRRPTTMYQFWFRTRGCTFDRAGQCSMCNYGTAPEIDQDRVVEAVRRRLAKVPEGSFVYLSPSGSLLDDREVAPELRARLLTLVAERRPAAFAFETRPELVSPGKLDEVRAALPGAGIVCHLGVESWDPLVRSLCQLKPTPQDSYRTALTAMAERDCEVIANVALGGLGLSHNQAYQDTLASVRGTRDAGFATQMVFPLSAKSGTLLGWAYDNGMWEPPSLWTLVQVLSKYLADGRTGGDIDVSWFDPGIDRVVRTRPDGCSACRPVLVSVFNAIRLNPVPASLDAANAWRGCDCPQMTEELLTPAPTEPSYQERLSGIMERWEQAHPQAVALGMPTASTTVRSA